MDLTSHLPQPRRVHLEGRLTSNLMARLTTVRPDAGRSACRSARHVPEVPPADQIAGYVVKHAERIAAMFGTPAAFAQAYSEPLVMTPLRLFA
jgi:hypothetical protein